MNFQCLLNGSAVKVSACNAGDTGDRGSIPGWRRSPAGRKSTPRQYSLEKEMATHSTILTWRIPWQTMESQSTGHNWVTNTHTPVFLPEKLPWTKKPGGLQSMGLQRVGHSWACTHIFELYLTVALKKAGSVEVVVLVVVMIIVTKTTSGYFRIFTMCQKLF